MSQNLYKKSKSQDSILWGAKLLFGKTFEKKEQNVFEKHIIQI